MKKTSALFWSSYISLILAGILLAILFLTACATPQRRKTDIPADWRFRREVINIHHKMKYQKIRNCNVE